MAPSTPTPDPVGPWVDGAVRGWPAATAYCGLSRAQLTSLKDAGRIACFPLGERGDWMFARRSLAEVLAGMHAEYLGEGVTTAEPKRAT